MRYCSVLHATLLLKVLIIYYNLLYKKQNDHKNVFYQDGFINNLTNKVITKEMKIFCKNFTISIYSKDFSVT